MHVRIQSYGVVEVVQYVALPQHPEDRPEALVHVRALPSDTGITDIVWRVTEGEVGPTGLPYLYARSGAYYDRADLARAEFARRAAGLVPA